MAPFADPDSGCSRIPAAGIGIRVRARGTPSSTTPPSPRHRTRSTGSANAATVRIRLDLDVEWDLLDTIDRHGKLRGGQPRGLARHPDAGVRELDTAAELIRFTVETNTPELVADRRAIAIERPENEFGGRGDPGIHGEISRRGSR
ncbi:hypothetical protein [Nocardia brasiliensis]|uniref:TetR family transcriptional regulator n=1 Tax=Nocardia brasiliensis (strain ATCC 700358 / HUJEG-1) TaxID=1133849 RepID=K0F2Z2_NOCB7|nr:hypothetical protein [Nocardia brasiliensis]AFU03804.1 TetR family transcriptional regulator [Nocardia brasiliensis ATCC 700358]